MKYINPGVMASLALLLMLSATAPGRTAETPVETGIRAYQDGDYRAAAADFSKAIESAPQDSVLHHWLGKCYGRIAEHGGWLTALSYAKKTLKQFRIAVQLDANNREALRDLADYLEQAPGFMGGDKQEAQRLRHQLETLRHAQAGQ